MVIFEMIWGLNNIHNSPALKKTTILLLSVVFFFAAASASEIAAQKKFSRTYPAPAGKDVRLELANRMGMVEVQGWERPEVSISAYLEYPAATIAPQSLSGRILINLVKDNQGRGEVGNVNFIIRVPYSSSVDIQTVMGNLSVTNVRGLLVRAKISTEGDITLTNIGASNVAAENIKGDIFFDGVINSGGIYRFTSMSGNINLRIPTSSSFQLVATAPSTRNIQLGTFSGAGLSFVSEGRRVIGKTGDGAASLTVTNQRGNIAFIKR